MGHMMAPIGLSVRELVGSARFTCSPQCVMDGSHDDTDRTERKRRVWKPFWDRIFRDDPDLCNKTAAPAKAGEAKEDDERDQEDEGKLE